LLQIQRSILGECLESFRHAVALGHEIHLRLTSIVPCGENNHEIKHDQSHAFRPVRFRVRRHIVDKEAGADKNSNFKQVEKEGEWPTSTPRKKHKERHPEKSELYAKVDGLAMRQRGWGGGLSEIMAEHMTDKVDNGDCTICRIGDEGEQDETKPFLLYLQYFADSFSTYDQPLDRRCCETEDDKERGDANILIDLRVMS